MMKTQEREWTLVEREVTRHGAQVLREVAWVRPDGTLGHHEFNVHREVGGYWQWSASYKTEEEALRHLAVS